MRVLMIAPPGAGKGTQGALIAAHFDIPHIATGELLRDHVARRTALGQAVQAYLDRGELVPDQVVLDMVREAMVAAKAAGGGYVLDGIPRNMQQARATYLIARELEMTADVALHLQGRRRRAHAPAARAGRAGASLRRHARRHRPAAGSLPRRDIPHPRVVLRPRNPRSRWMRCVPRSRSAAKSWPPSKRCAPSWTRCPGRHGAPLTSPASRTRSAPPAPAPGHPAEPSDRLPGLASARHGRCRISATAGPVQRRRETAQGYSARLDGRFRLDMDNPPRPRQNGEIDKGSPATARSGWSRENGTAVMQAARRRQTGAVRGGRTVVLSCRRVRAIRGGHDAAACSGASTGCPGRSLVRASCCGAC